MQPLQKSGWVPIRRRCFYGIFTGIGWCRWNMDCCSWSALAAHNIPFESRTFMEGSHGGGRNTRADALGRSEWDEPNVARWMEDCCQWLERIFGEPELDAEEFNMEPLSEDRARMGVPSFRLSGGMQH